MNKGLSITIRLACVIATLLIPLFAWGDEGLWLFSNPPKKELLERYNFNLTDEFLQNLQFSSLRFSSGGSASFVSPSGLVMTNHHVAISSLQKLSSPDSDLVTNGYYAATAQQELLVPELEVLLLANTEDVTQRVNSAVTNDMDYAEAQEARRAMMNTIEQESFQATGFKSDVITLYQGAEYHLYRYKKFNDIRLVFAPEENIGFFGGEPDNFEYPRYNLDLAFFRIYENGVPYQPPRYLHWSPQGAAEGELVFVSGHPARTNRFDTVEHLLFRRDYSVPYMLNKARRKEIVLQLYAEKSQENARRVASELFRIRNTRKNLTGVLLGLQTPSYMAKPTKAQSDLIAKVQENKLIDLEQYNPWDTVYQSLAQLYEVYYLNELVEKGDAFDSELYRIAKGIVQYTEETQKPVATRLREYQDAELPNIRNKILSPLPIYPDLEMVKLTDSLGLYFEQISDWEIDGNQQDQGFDLLNQKSPKERAIELISQTKLADVAFRRTLLEGGVDAVNSSTDPMIRFALAVNELCPEIRDLYEGEVVEPLRRAYSQITLLRKRLLPETPYPDATFTLRLSFGKVAGYKEDDGSTIPAWTPLSGLFQRAKEHEFAHPYDLPDRWLQAEGKVNAHSPINLVSTNDIIGGNSGSPLVNGKGEIVGLIFDGNIQSLVSNFIYTEEQGRAVSVHSTGIIDTLHNVYNASRLVNEIVEASRQ